MSVLPNIDPSQNEILTDLSQNQILADLPEDEAARLLPNLGFVPANPHDVLYEVGDPIRYNYFPQDCVISWLAIPQDGKSVEVALKGKEAVVGIEALLGAQKATGTATVQVPGGCLRIRAELLQSEFRRTGVLHYRLLHYIRYLLAQVEQTAACNRVHPLEQRLSRWLLMTHDRARVNAFSMTYEFIANVLGAPRPEVTDAAENLCKSGLIRYGHGQMIILDRKGLESASCQCYQIAAAKFNDLSSSAGRIATPHFSASLRHA